MSLIKEGKEQFSPQAYTPTKGLHSNKAYTPTKAYTLTKASIHSNKGLAMAKGVDKTFTGQYMQDHNVLCNALDECRKWTREHYTM